MAKPYASLERIDNNRPITPETDHKFLYRLQSGLLLALKENERLSEPQYRYAQEQLDRQRREQIKKLPQKGVRP
ncbi:hypothetical protein [Intestinibacillus sp. Marseille-P6563]|uniref:hypothetical protein n=1 Tax=Intestinibacillus sp. Marseille-P6563 TaxID=2364792 RepID=UPI000F06075A|nr:hypothetical protein [Intestinibacillus sp. Marseille-P6563]